MSNGSWKRIRKIFNEALERPESERGQFLESACGDDEVLRSEVDRLLRAHSDAGGFMASPTIEDEALDDTDSDERQPTAAAEGPGSRIGPYKLLQLIGEGGFGSVYMAEQETPIRRRVALKIIKLGMDTREVIARFEAERQTLAMMDHPGIAHVFDAGSTDSGRPYFVMELVKGVPITEYCDAQRLGTRERLELFKQVCGAVDHAHSKGVIHRDIKPSNVMVTLHDGTPVPKVIDFGVAKATNHRLTEKTLFTRYGEFIGTPAYMSPEQAEMSGLDVDRRSDIYSLGVLLYELLTGTVPFEPGQLRAAAFLEVVRVLQEEAPPTPSSRLSTLGNRLEDVAKRRQAQPHALVKLLRGDLDWIVMKALEKDRSRRYETAIALAEDIDRHFAHLPVTARRPSRLYRWGKLAKRRKQPIMFAAALAIAVLLGLTIRPSEWSAGLAEGQTPAPSRRLIQDRAGDFNKALPTRDGRHLLRYSEDRRGYELVDIQSGDTELITHDGPDAGDRFFVSHDLSPVGDLIAAVHRFSPDPGVDSSVVDAGPIELRLLERGGVGEGRLLRRWDPGHHVQVFGWSPDGARIWIHDIRPDRSAEIASVAVDNGAVDVLETLGERTITQAPSLSPDGRFVAYHDSENVNDPADIFILATDGSSQVRVRDPAHDLKPLFAPDGSGIVFRSRRPGGDLWFLPLADGRPSGEPRPVWDDVSPYGTATLFADNGSLFYSFATNRSEIYTADVSFETARIAQPERVLPRNGEMNDAPAFSPDGRLLAHLRDRGRRLVIRDLRDGAERELPLSSSLLAPAIDFCPDSRSVVVSGWGPEPRISVVDVNRGGAELLPVTGAGRAVCSGPDEVVYLHTPDPRGPSRLVRQSRATGEEVTLYEGMVVPHFLSGSPDGRRISFIALEGGKAELMVTATAGGEPVTLATSPRADVWTEFHGVMWARDGNGVILVRAPLDTTPPIAESPEATFWRVSVEGGSPEEVGRMRLPPFENAYGGSNHYSLHPDGSRITFHRHAGLVAQRWAIDNLMAFIRSGASVQTPRLNR